MRLTLIMYGIVIIALLIRIKTQYLSLQLVVGNQNHGK